MFRKRVSSLAFSSSSSFVPKLTLVATYGMMTDALHTVNATEAYKKMSNVDYTIEGAVPRQPRTTKYFVIDMCGTKLPCGQNAYSAAIHTIETNAKVSSNHQFRFLSFITMLNRKHVNNAAREKNPAAISSKCQHCMLQLRVTRLAHI